VKLLFGIPGDGWLKAARHLGHKAARLDPKRAFDSFLALRPDAAVLTKAQRDDRAVRRCLAEVPCRLGVPGEDFPDDPATDWLPDEPPGEFRQEFACDVAFVGDWTAERERWLWPLCASTLDVKIFGSGPYPFAQRLGAVRPDEVADVWASAKVSLELDGDWGRVMDVWAAGGFCAGTLPASRPPAPLSGLLHQDTPENLFDLVADLAARMRGRGPGGAARAEVLAAHTKAHLLHKFLES
jgi:hypothetical protein